jgi:hypothetical protein
MSGPSGLGSCGACLMETSVWLKPTFQRSYYFYYTIILVLVLVLVLLVLDSLVLLLLT